MRDGIRVRWAEPTRVSVAPWPRGDLARGIAVPVENKNRTR